MTAVEIALAELGVRRLLLAIHDASLPSDPDEDIGRGSAATRAAERLFGFARALGFTGIQLGPAGQTSRDNPSPYDATIFSRHLGGISLHAFAPGGPFAGLVDERSLARAVLDPGGGAIGALLASGSSGPPSRSIQHSRAHDAIHALVAEAYAALGRGARPDLRGQLDRFIADNQPWLARDMVYAGYSELHGGAGHRDWPPRHAAHWDAPPVDETTGELAEIGLRHAFGQLLAHAEHARVRAVAATHHLALYGDLQVGYSDADAWAYRGVFLRDYVMGAPPSRTTPEGQPWNYPVLDPAQLGPSGGALALIVARADKAFAEYDAIRIDHPHGLVCPWVYRAGAADPGAAVRDGARLYESPDLAEHPALAGFAIARPDQLDRALPRYHDRWVRDLEPAQVARYARLVDALGAAAARHGRTLDDLSCEVLSTLPHPLACVLARHHLGRWRVLQKANLDDPGDVYRTENAAREDWVMLGNHDTPSIFGLIRAWPAAVRERWARHLTARLALDAATAAALARDDGLLASAMLAELFASRAENVSIFFADLFGYDDRYNVPGTIASANWTLRLPADFDAVYRDRLARRAALDIPLALALARRGSSDPSSR